MDGWIHNELALLKFTVIWNTPMKTEYQQHCQQDDPLTDTIQ